MIRTFTLAVALYAYGQPCCHDYRPAMLDRPVQAFYADVNSVARQARRALALVNDPRTKQYFTSYLTVIGQQLNSAF
jgi:hypothetical protein